jgi:hypothetical protein
VTPRTLALAACCALLAALRAQAPPELCTLQVEPPVAITDALAVDVDGDGRRDVVLACTGERGARELRRFLRRGARCEAAGAPYRVERDAIAFAFADVDPAAGRELVLFTAEHAIAVVAGDGEPRYVPLFPLRLLWPAPDPDALLPLRTALRDVDGDGDEDLVLPEPGGWRLVLVERGEAGARFAAQELRLPEPRGLLLPTGGGSAARFGGGRFDLRLDLGGDARREDEGPLVAVDTRTAPLQFVDLDGDGDLDAVAVQDGELLVFAQGEPGAFAAVPARVPLPLPPDRLSVFDPAFDVQLADFDGDRRADLVLTTSASRDGRIEVRIDLCLQQQDGAFAERAASRLRLDTLATSPQLADVDGDGRPDAAAVTVRVDLLQSMTGGGGTLSAQWNLFRGEPGRLRLPAAGQHALELPPSTDGRRPPFARTLGRTGDRGPGLLWRDAPTSLTFQPLVADGERWRPAATAWRLPIAEQAAVRLLPGEPAEVLVLGERECMLATVR